MTKKFDLAWGESVVVRQALALNVGGYQSRVYSPFELQKMGYTDHYGDPQIVELTREVIKRQTGMDYNHILLTNGASGGLSVALRAYAKRGHDVVLTNPPPFYPLYPVIFEAAGLSHITLREFLPDSARPIFLLDSPSNPLSAINSGVGLIASYSIPLVWDAVYSNKIYAPGCRNPGSIADVMIGSYSKLLGTNGIRLGWLATNDSILFERFKSLVDAEYAGLSAPSQEVLLSILQNIDWEGFERSAKLRLDANRGEWQRLEKYFDGQEVNKDGMFFYGPMDKAAKKLFTNAGISWVSGTRAGDTDEFGRFNLAQDCGMILQAVLAVLRADKSK